jgi:CHAD domain-containing protein
MAAPGCKEVQEHVAVGSAVNELGPVRELEVLDEECRIVLVIVGADGQGRVLHSMHSRTRQGYSARCGHRGMLLK